DERDELAPLHRCNHSITSSARASSVGGTSRPSAWAAFRLMTNSYLTGACTGRSAAFSPLRIPAKFLQGLLESFNTRLSVRIVRSEHHQHPDAPHPLGLLRTRSDRPGGRAAEQRDELPALHCPMPPVLPTERIAHLGTADCRIHPPGRYETIAVTPPIIFSRR